MRENWTRATPSLELKPNELTELIAPAFPGQTVKKCQVAEGGLANTNIRVRLSGLENDLLLRLFVRDPQQAEKEYRIYELVAGKLPTPKLFYFAQDNALTRHPYIVREWVEGERLEKAVVNAEADAITMMGHSVGSVLSAIHSIKFEQAGFFNERLHVVHPIDIGSKGLISFARQCLLENIGGQRLGMKLTEAVLKFLDREAKLLDEWSDKPCLSHSDFGGSNILVDGAQRVSAVLDWEFAFSGTPFFDLGNLLRRPLGQLSGFEQAVYQGYDDAGGKIPSSWRKMSLLSDLTAWFEFLTRPDCGEALIADAQRVIRETMADWNS